MFVAQRKTRIALVASLLVLVFAAFVWGISKTPAPVLAHADARAEGAEIFATSGCSHCHGNTAQGTDKGPSLRNVRQRLTAAQIHQQIVGGGKSMPPFGDAIEEQQIAALVDLLRGKHPELLLQKQAAASHP